MQDPSKRSLQDRGNETLMSSQWNSLPKRGLVLTSEQSEIENAPLGSSHHQIRSDLKPVIETAVSDPAKSTPIFEGAIEKRVQSIPTEVQPLPPFNAQASYADRRLEQLDRETLARGTKVSQHLLEEGGGPKDPPPPAIESPIGWNAIQQQMESHLRQCDEYLRRGATHSARQEALTGMRLLFRSLDQRRNAWTSEPDLDQALLALKEEADFHSSLRNPQTARSVTAIVATHRTPVLHQTELSQTAPEIAAQFYRAFAKDRLVSAAERHAWASDLFYSYGKCLEKIAFENEVDRKLHLEQSVVWYKAALETHSDYPEAANQLGYVLLQLDRVDDAQLALEHSLRLQPSPSVFRNIAELYRRQGNSSGQQWALQLAQQNSPPPNANVPTVQQVDPTTFAQLSPYPSHIQFNQRSPEAAADANDSNGATGSNPNANSRASWMTRIFR